MKPVFQEIFHLLSSFEILLDDTEDSAALGTVLEEVRDNLINSNPNEFSLNKDFFNLSCSGFICGYCLEGF